MNKINTKIVGVTFENRQELISNLVINQILNLVPEPDNLYDPNAIAVKDSKNNHLGYLNKDLAVDFAQGIKKGITYFVQVAGITRNLEKKVCGCNIEITKI